MKTLIGVLLAAMLVALSIASPVMAAPQGPWILPATNISAPGQNASSSQITTAPDGTATAVWRGSDGSNAIVQSATRPPGGSFGPPVDLLSAAGQNAEAPQIAIAPDGTTTAVWSRFDVNNLTGVIQAATRLPGGSFGAPVDLSAAGQYVFGPQIAIAPDGTATAVWRRSDDATSTPNSIIQAATRPPGGSFGTPVDLSAPGQFAHQPQITTAPDGTATAVWRRFDGSNYIIQAATRPPGGSFGAPVDLSEAGRGAADPQIATAPDGTATAVWYRWDGTNFIIQASTRPPGGSFGTPVDLSATGQDAVGPQVTTALDGTATAVWERSEIVSPIRVYDGIQAATRPPGGSFGAPVDLSAPAILQGSQGPQITTAPDGTATAVWSRLDGSNYIIQAATRLPGGAFGAPVDLSATGQDAFAPQITTAPDGTATAAWSRFSGSIQAASTAGPSSRLLLQVNRSGTGSGKVTSTPPGIDCGSDCAENYPSFTKVTLTATPDTGSTFTGWSGADCSGTGTCEVTMLEATSVTAAFGKPKLAKPKIKPKSKKVRRGKKVTFRVKVKNTGNATAKKLKLCAKGPKKLVKALKKCRKPGKLAPGKSKTLKFKVKVKNRAKKGKKAKITFTAYAKGAKKKSAKATVKVR